MGHEIALKMRFQILRIFKKGRGKQVGNWHIVGEASPIGWAVVSAAKERCPKNFPLFKKHGAIMGLFFTVKNEMYRADL